MTYSPEAERQVMRDSLARLVTEGGPGWNAYALHRAQQCEKEDPTLHAGLEAHVRSAIKAHQPKEIPHAV